MAAQQTFAFFQNEDAVRTDTATTRNRRSNKSATAKKKSEQTKQKQLDQQQTGLSRNKHTPPQATSQLQASPQAGPQTESPLVQSLSEAESLPSLPRSEILKQLRARVGCVSTAPINNRPKLSTGCSALDQWLPGGGLRVDALTEWVAGSDSSGAAALSLIAAANYLNPNSSSQLASSGQSHSAGPLVVVDALENRIQQFYPPAAMALGIPADQIILVRPPRDADHRANVVWAIDQALRSQSVGAVWAHVGSWLDDRDARRFQLAAETGNTPGLLVRPAAVRGKPSFAEVRFHVSGDRHANDTPEKVPDTFLAQVTLDRCRGDALGKQAWVQIDDQARVTPIPAVPNTIPTPVPQLVPSTFDEKIIPSQTATMHLADQLARPTPTASVQTSRQRSSQRRA